MISRSRPDILGSGLPCSEQTRTDANTHNALLFGMRLRPTTPAHHTISRPVHRSCHVDLPVRVAPFKEGIGGPVF